MKSWLGVLCGGAATAVSVLVRIGGTKIPVLGEGRTTQADRGFGPAAIGNVAGCRTACAPGNPARHLRRQAGPAAEPDPGGRVACPSTLSASVAPNSYVVAELTGRHELLLHVLVDTRRAGRPGT